MKTTLWLPGGAWPASTVVLCLTNDLVWWIPFSLYLYDAWPEFIRTMKYERGKMN